MFFYSTIGALGPDAARGALADPAATVGGRFLPDALDMLLAATEGYPYFLQEFGAAVWEVAAASPFADDDAAAAIEVGTAHLDQGFFPSRWDRATPVERRYLRAIADTGQPTPKTADLSITQNTAGPLRASLIRKGIVYSPEHGRIAAFTVLGHGRVHRPPTKQRRVTGTFICQNQLVIGSRYLRRNMSRCEPITLRDPTTSDHLGTVPGGCGFTEPVAAGAQHGTLPTHVYLAMLLRRPVQTLTAAA